MCLKVRIDITLTLTLFINVCMHYSVLGQGIGCPKSQVPANPNELEYDNPLYKRMEMFTKPNTSPVHHYDYVTVRNV